MHAHVTACVRRLPVGQPLASTQSPTQDPVVSEGEVAVEGHTTPHPGCLALQSIQASLPGAAAWQSCHPQRQAVRGQSALLKLLKLMN